jgi:transposase InsO family protein
MLERRIMREEKRRLNVSGVLRILGVSRSGYKSFREREFDKPKKPSRKDELKMLILDVYLKSKQIYGAPKITKELAKMGIKVAEKTVGNYMREMKIKAHYVKPYIKTTVDPDFDSRLKNLLNEQFNPDKPNAIWCTDITYSMPG